MKYLKPFNESYSYPTDPKEIWRLLREICPYDDFDDYFNRNPLMVTAKLVRIHTDGTVDVDGSIAVYNDNITRLPIKFGKVTGTFRLSGAQSLTTLEGSPKSCDNFECVRIPNVKNLKGGPKEVVNYDIDGCCIESLEGAPEEVSGYFSAYGADLTSLKGGPKTVGGYFTCESTRITDLVGGPEIVGTSYNTRGTRLKSLEGAPKECDYLIISESGGFIWDPRPLKDCRIRGIQAHNQPIEVLMNAFCPPGPVILGDDLIAAYKNWLNSLDYNYVRGTRAQPQINLFRFKEALSEFDITNPFGKDPNNPIFHLNFIPYDLVDDEGKRVDFFGNLI